MKERLWLTVNSVEVELSGKVPWQDPRFQRGRLIASQLPRSPERPSLVSPVLALCEPGVYPACFGWSLLSIPAPILWAL